MAAKFKAMYQQVANRLGSEAALLAALPEVRPPQQLKSLSDSRYLSALCLRLFRAGLKHSMVDAKWPRFEAVFYGFNPQRLAELTDEELEQLLQAEGIIRHWGKVKAVRANARFVQSYSLLHGGFGNWIAAWPVPDIVHLWQEMARQGAQMGGLSAPSVLRYLGKDTFLLTTDVAAVLTEQRVIEGNPMSKRNLAAAQAQFNTWHNESGLPYSHISRIVSMTVNQQHHFI